MATLRIGSRVVERRTGRLGQVVRGPRRASRSMLWVLWVDADKPLLWDRIFLKRCAS